MMDNLSSAAPPPADDDDPQPISHLLLKQQLPIPATSQLPSTATLLPHTAIQEPHTATQQPGTSHQQPDTAAAQPDTDPHLPDTDPQQPGTAPHLPDTDPQQPGTAPHLPDTDPQQPGTAPHLPDTDPQQPGAALQQPDQQHPSTSHDQTPIASSTEDEEEEEYEVLDLLNRRQARNGLYEFHVRWADQSTTWEPEYNLNDTCQNLIDQLNAQLATTQLSSASSTSNNSRRLRSRSLPLKGSPTLSSRTNNSRRLILDSDSSHVSSDDDDRRPPKKMRSFDDVLSRPDALHFIDPSDTEDLESDHDILTKLQTYFAKVPHWHRCFACGLPPKKPGNKRNNKKPATPLIMCDRCFCSYHSSCLNELRGQNNGTYPHFTSSKSMVCPGCISSMGKHAAIHKKYNKPLPCMYCPKLVQYNLPAPVVICEPSVKAPCESSSDSVLEVAGDPMIQMEIDSVPEVAVDPSAMIISSDPIQEVVPVVTAEPVTAASPVEPQDFPEPLNLNGTHMETINQCHFRCTKCSRGAHWVCAARALISRSVQTTGKTPSDWSALYSLIKQGMCWVCIDVQDSRDVQSILAYREIGSGNDWVPPEIGNKLIDTYEMLFKFVGKSYRDVKWIPQSWLCATAPSRFRIYLKSIDEGKVSTDPEDAINSDWTVPFKVLDLDEDANLVLIQWKRLTQSEATWEPFLDNKEVTESPEFVHAMDVYLRAQSINSVADRAKRRRGPDWRPSPKSWGEGLTSQPEEIKGGVLMAHQIEGLSWLIGNWCARWNCLLSDEMGLGKTVQIVTFLNYIHMHHARYPFLVVVPNSTLDNWDREFKKWAPNLHVVSSWGLAKDRDIIEELELFWPRKREGLAVKCHVVLATYESVLLMEKLRQVRWDVLVVDEGHRLKNDESKLFKSLSEFKFDHKVLLTGTPLQNNLRELFNLMLFLEIEGFDDPEKMALEYDLDNGNWADDDATGELAAEKVRQLHEKLRPHLLRRVKRDVVINIPPKAEILVPVRMSPLQRQLIRDMYSRSYSLLKALGMNARINSAPPGSSASSNSSLGGSSLQNLLMQCRKTLSHPFCMDNVEEGLPATTSESEKLLRTIDSCGKFALLAKMLPKLQEGGHKVLIFVQFRMATEIMSEFLDGMQSVPISTTPGEPGKPMMRPFTHYTLDGSTERADRQQAIDEFNDNPDAFAFILSTRAGGVGINLTAADTVIIYDVDWNPHLDVQAIARCHRIGQMRPVLAFKFMTVESVEEKMIAVGRKKLALDHVIVQRMGKNNEANKEGLGNDLLEALKFGAFAVLSEDFSSASNANWQYTDDEVTQLLDRSQAIETAVVPESGQESPDSATATGGKAGYGFSKVWLTKKTAEGLNENENDQSPPNGLGNVDDVGYGQSDIGVEWDLILEKLKDTAPPEIVLDASEAGSSTKRKRKQVDYSNTTTKTGPTTQNRKKQGTTSAVSTDSDKDTDFVPIDHVTSDEEEALKMSDILVEDGPHVLLGAPKSKLQNEAVNNMQAPPQKRGPNPALPPATKEEQLALFKTANRKQKQASSPKPFPRASVPGNPMTASQRAKLSAQSMSCWVCFGTKHQVPGYHVPTQCPAIHHRDWVLQEVDRLKKNAVVASCSSSPNLMDRNRLTFLYLVLESWDSEA